VPLGLHHRGRLRIQWNLEVNGQKLSRGTYQITLRGFDRHHNVLGTSRPTTLVLH
jgi:hypothetical protein